MATLALSLVGQVVGGAVGGPIGATIGRALGALAGSAVDAALFAERPAPRQGLDFRLQGSSEGGAIPRLYGWSRLAGNIIWATELEGLEVKAGKGSEEADEVAANFAVAFCEGEVTRLGRIWADGQLLDPAGLNLRFYRGTETQAADSLIEAKQGVAPAYRGLCYLVFERLPLSAFGNRIPNISVELCRVVGELEPAIRAVTVIPGATEFGYDPEPRVRIMSRGVTANENAHLLSGVSDWSLSIDELVELCPNLKHVSLVVAWFGDDLRAGHCTIRPKVEAAGRLVKGANWAVAGLTRATAEVVSWHDGGPAYGGTPSDAAVRAAIADLKARGLTVTLYPLVLMDIPVGNEMGQPAYPWRGRIGGSAADVEDFVGTTGDWGYRRFVRHYAQLAATAGAETLVLGSELRGLTAIRDGASFPFVEALRVLAGEARAIAGPALKLTYAADWSEYFGLQPEDAPGDRYFHLDPLWADENIDAVGIDNYMPLSDWRDGETQPDAGWLGPYELDYLKANIAGGEGFEWYYASDADRLAGLRTPITDGAHDEPWIWRFKDLENWWRQPHHQRIGGVRSETPTAWVPGSKPIWFTELGCAAVDRGSNQPNVFPDPKSAESGLPYFSSGAAEGLAQRQFLRAHLDYWVSEANPEAELYAGRMVDAERIALWTWDARPFPVFPNAGDLWKDARNHAAGHWLTGRLGAPASDELIRAVAADYGIAVATAEAVPPQVAGLVIEGVVSARDALAPVLAATGLHVVDHAQGLGFALVRPDAVTEIGRDELAAGEAALLARLRPDPVERVGQLALGYADRAHDYGTGVVTALRLDGGVPRAEGPSLTLDAAAARAAAERMLIGAALEADTLELALPPSLLALEAGDVIAVEAVADGPFEIVAIRDGPTRRVTARAVPPMLNAAIVAGEPPAVRGGAAPLAVPEVLAAQLPPEPATPGTSRLLLAGFASPWPGRIDIVDSEIGVPLTRLTGAATLGELTAPLPAGPTYCWDRQETQLRLFGFHIADSAPEAVLAGSNRLAVEGDDGSWEVLGFRRAELIAPGLYRLSGLLRGLGGSGRGPASAGNSVVLLDERVRLLPVPDNWLGTSPTLIAYAGLRDAVGTVLEADLGLGPVLPLAPTHLRARRRPDGAIELGWIRCSRADGDGWALADAPLEHLPEAYRVSIYDGAEVVRHLDCPTAQAVYGTAEQSADFGGAPDGFTFTVAQLSPVFGPGQAASGVFNG